MYKIENVNSKYLEAHRSSTLLRDTRKFTKKKENMFFTKLCNLLRTPGFSFFESSSAQLISNEDLDDPECSN